MIKKLILENWKSHLKTEVSFEDGYNVIVGNIGSGKTSIIEGIVYGLFGTTQNIISKKVQVKDMIMTKPTEMDSAKITLFFEKDNKKYKVERTIFKNKSSQAKLYENDKLIRGPKPSDVTEEIEKILNTNIDVFMRANFSEQNQIDFFLKMPPQQRKIMFDNMFGIDFYDTIAVNARKLSNNIKNITLEKIKNLEELKILLQQFNFEQITKELESTKNQFKELENKKQNKEKEFTELKEKIIIEEKKEKEYEDLQTKLKNLKGKIDYLEREVDLKKSIRTIEEIEKNIKEAKEKYNKLKGEKEKWEQKNKEITTLKERKNNLNIQIKNLEEKIKNVNLDKDLNIEIKNIEEKIKNIKQSLENTNKEIIKETSYLNEKEKMLKELEEKEKTYLAMKEKFSKYAEKSKEYEEKIKKIEELKEKITELNTKINQTKNNLKELTTAGAICPVCEQPIDEKHKHKVIEERKEKIKKMENEKQKTEEKLKEETEEITALQITIKEIEQNKTLFEELKQKYENKEKIKKEVENLKNKINELEEIKKTLTENIDKNTKELLLKKEELITIENAKKIKEEIKKYEQNIKEINLQLDILEKEIAKKPIENLDEIKDKIIIYEKELENVKKINELNNTKKMIENINIKIKQIDFNKEEFIRLKTNLKELESSIKYLDELIKQTEKNIKDIENRKEQYLKIKEKLKEEDNKIKELKTKTEDLMIFSNVAKKTQEEVRQMMIEKVNEIFMELWPKVYPYDDFEKIKLDIVNGDYKIILYFNKNYKRELDEYVSGGEKSAIALTLRIAISLVMQNDLLILDEPTHNLDEQSVLTLSKLFNEYLNKFVKQIIVITHDKMLENYARNVIKVERDKSEDLPSKIVSY